MFTFCKNLGHGECIYNVIDTKDTAAPKMPMYKSRFWKAVKNERACSIKGNFKTMGLPHTCLFPSHSYLKKHSRAPISILAQSDNNFGHCKNAPNNRCQTTSTMTSVWGQPGGCESSTTNTCSTPEVSTCGLLSSSEPEKIPTCDPPKCGEECSLQAEQTGTETDISCSEPPYLIPQKCRISRICRECCHPEKPRIPPASLKFALLDRGRKDFLVENFLRASRRPPKIAEAKLVDKYDGNRVDWCNSGYPRKFVGRKDYGMIPGYLVERNMELAKKDEETIAKFNGSNQEAQEKCRHLDETERQCLINGLKSNWAEIFRDFQSLPLNIDTPGKVHKKSELEAALRDVEKDIQLLERHNHIFVADTKKSFYLA